MNEIAFAARMRDVIQGIANDTVARLRPEPKLGKVYDFDLASYTADVLFPGETINSLITVKFGLDTVPTNSMVMNAPGGDVTQITNDTLANIVRVAGRMGAYYIDGFVYGQSSPIVPIGGIIEYLGSAAPDYSTDQYANAVYLRCDGSVLNIADYPQLFNRIGFRYGGDGSTTFALPVYVGSLPDLTWTVADPAWITAQTGYSVASATLYRRGNIATFLGTFTRTGAAVGSSGALGDLSNVNVATIIDPSVPPAAPAFAALNSASTGPAMTGYLNNNGNVALAAGPQNYSMATNDQFSLGGSWVCKDPTDIVKIMRVR